MSVDTDPDTPLIYVLRNDFDFKGAKLGCALEQCGACIVLVDGEPTNSCVRAAAEFQGMQIETVENFGNPEKMSEIQQIFAEENVAQCGYCTAGIVCSVTALFRKTRQPSDHQIKETLNRHLCRCGSHSRILDAVNRIRTGVTG